MKIIVAMGRGGVGKTSFVALMAKFFIELEETPLFLIDADPDQNLADMVGVDLKQAGNETLSEILYDFQERGGSLTGTPPQDRLEPIVWEKGLYEGSSLDLITLGTKWGEGCYCLPNSLLKNIIPTIAKNYRYTLIDSPAGLEHLNRRITTEVEDIFD
ncbi:MAG: AAA family ATPase, partial [Desulfobacterales bacterium]|nr:AAA family ATPase [Desulfobacterales bacterium]